MKRIEIFEFDADRAGRALRIEGYDLADDPMPEPLKDGRWRVRAVSRMVREDLGAKILKVSGDGDWTVEKGEVRDRAGGEIDPVALFSRGKA